LGYADLCKQKQSNAAIVYPIVYPSKLKLKIWQVYVLYSEKKKPTRLEKPQFTLGLLKTVKLVTSLVLLWLKWSIGTKRIRRLKVSAPIVVGLIHYCIIDLMRFKIVY
jgi:hypothetical protein